MFVRMKRSVLAALVLLLAVGHGERAAARPPNAAGWTPAGRAWVAMVRRQLPTALCANGYFRACFAIDPRACEALAVRQFDVCLQQQPAVVPAAPDAASGARAGQILGACAGGGLERALVAQGRRRAAPECSDPSRWR